MRGDRNNFLSKTKRLVIKIGSSLLTDEKKKGINNFFLRHLAEQVKAFQSQGIECLIVTSGAIAAGCFELGLKKRPLEISKLQALAAVGQSKLMHNYAVTFDRFGLKIAQVLLTRDDLSNRHRYSNAHNTLAELFQNEIVPIVNENDTVAVEEIKFGDNDTLAVLVTHLSEADLLVLLTDTDGFFEEDPKLNPNTRLISDVFSLTNDLKNNAKKSKSLFGTGGMKTKILAANNMMQSGLPMVIANGKTRNVLKRILDAEIIGTFFYPANKKMNNRKRWLAWGVKPRGEIMVDEGAKKAILVNSKSLLPTGVKKISGHWNGGDVVKVIDLNRREIAKGIANYSSDDLDQIKGLNTSEMQSKLGYKLVDEVIHKDNLVRIEVL